MAFAVRVKNWNRLGLRAKIILPLAVFAVLVSMVGIGLLYRSETREHARQLHRRASMLAQAIVYVAESTSDADHLQRFVSAMALETDIKLIVVTSGSPPQVIASTHPEWIGKPLTELPPLYRASGRGATQPTVTTATKTLRLVTRLPNRVPEDDTLRLEGGQLLLQVDAGQSMQQLAPHTRLVSMILLTAILGASIVAYAWQSDISDLKAVENELQRAAKMDRLTGLPNRTLLLERLQNLIRRVHESPQHKFAVMFLDFDRFKIINDSLGHDVGDALLREIASRLRRYVRSVDSINYDVQGHTTARLGGDEFVVLLDHLKKTEDALEIADRLMTAFAEPCRLGPHEVTTSASIGIVIGTRAYLRAEDVLRDADTAMYEAKRGGKARYVVFDNCMRENVKRRLLLENELRKALERDELFLLYQPIVSLDTGALISVEALVRWQHPVHGLIPPDDFIPVAEDTGQILDIGDWVFREGCRQLAEWRANLGPAAPGVISINLSRRQFVLPSLPQSIQQVIAESGIPPHCVQLEITESTFMSNVAAAVQAMQAIKELGVKLAVDDFGTGFSSLACLHQFPVDTLKIDRSFTKGVDQAKDMAALIHAVSILARNLNIATVAEGVEHSAEVISLQELGCDFAQGYFFGKPMSAADIACYCLENRKATLSSQGAMAFANRWAGRLSTLIKPEHTHAE